MAAQSQTVLFEQIGFERYQFPLPQYLGAKFDLLGWIAKFIPETARIALDAFAGSQSVAYLLKQRGLQVHFFNTLQNYSEARHAKAKSTRRARARR